MSSVKRTKITFFASLAFVAITASACSENNAARDENQALEVEETQAVKDLRILAADDMWGREAGTEGNAKARDYLIGRLRDMGVPPMAEDYVVPFEYTPRRRGGGEVAKHTGLNIFGLIKGKNDGEAMVVSAHYDHVGTRGDDIYNGADDNASGTAGALAVAEHFVKNQPEYDVIIALFDAEEKGLQGARAYVASFENIKDHIAFNMNMDMISRDINNELWMSGLYHFPELQPLARKLIPMGKVELKLGKDIPGTGSADWTFSSDHGPFIAVDVPAIYFGVDFHPDYHKPTDTFDNVTMDYYLRAIETVVISAEYLDESLAEIIALSDAADAAEAAE